MINGELALKIAKGVGNYALVFCTFLGAYTIGKGAIELIKGEKSDKKEGA